MATIINHRNVGTIYTAWFSIVGLVVASAIYIYWLQQRTPFNTSFEPTAIYVCSAVAVVFAILALLFKYRFKQEIIAWIWLLLIAWLGVGVLLGYGWHWGLTLFMVVSFVLLLATGPYLYFE